MALADVLKAEKKLLKRGPGARVVKPKDYDVRIADLENPTEVVNTVLARLQVASTFRYPWEREWRRAFMAWMQRLDTVAEDSWESKRYVPMILKHVETVLPSITSAVWNGQDLWKIKGMTPEGRDAADALEKLLHWQAHGPSNLMKAFDNAVFFAVVFGTTFLDTGWSSKTEVRQTPVVVQDVDEKTGELLFTPSGGPVPVKVLEDRETVVEDWPVFDAISPLDAWPAPVSEAGCDGEWLIYAEETTLNKLKESAGEGHFDLDAIEAFEKDYYPEGGGLSQTTDDQVLFESANADLWNEWLNDLGYENRDDQDAEDLLDGDKTIKILIYRSKKERITLAPTKAIIGYSHNPYIHGKTGIVNYQFIPIPDCPFGRGPGTILLSHQELANENINLFMDTSKISLMAPVVVNKANVSSLDRNFTWEPNVLIHSRDVNNAAKRLDVPPPTNLALMFDQTLNRDADEMTGFNDASRGMSAQGNQTATEFSGLQSNVATRSFMHIRRMRAFMTDIGTMMISLNQQFMTQEQVITVVGEDGLDYKTVEPWEIVGGVTAIALPSIARANPAMRAQQMLAATQVVMPVLQGGSAPPMFVRWVRELLDVIGIEDVDRIIPKNTGQVRDPLMENVALAQGVKINPSQYENHTEHIQAHSAFVQEVESSGQLGAQGMEVLMDHIQAHASMAQQQGEAGQQGPSATQDRESAQALGAAQGADGIPGQSSPGPQAAPGRPT